MLARENPFAAERVLAVRYRLGDGSWEDLLGRLGELGYRASIVGPVGSGKTTLLEDIGERLAPRGFRALTLRLRRGMRDPLGAIAAGLEPPPGPRDLVLLDGAEQLGALAWRRFLSRVRGAGGLVITSHRRGRLPVLRECRTDPGLLAAIVRDLLGEVPEGISARLPGLFADHRGDLRGALRALYDLYAEMG